MPPNADPGPALSMSIMISNRTVTAGVPMNPNSRLLAMIDGRWRIQAKRISFPGDAPIIAAKCGDAAAATRQ